MTIPVYIMEEHKEAYYYWHLMRSKGEIAATNNFLLHVDHHSDFSAGHYPFNLAETEISVEEAKRRSYELLGIADFIVPAIYEGLFDEYQYVYSFKTELQQQELYIRKDENWLEVKLLKPELKIFLRGKSLNRRAFNSITGGLATFTKDAAKPLVLDVDLDYFCWDNSLITAGVNRIEITKAQYEEIVGNTYHPLRLMAKPKFAFIKEEEHYYLEVLQQIKSKTIPDQQTILERMDNFFAWLKDQNIMPAAIDICRSRISGYLPRTVFPWIEEEFLTRLEKLYEIEIVEKPD